MVQNSNSFCSQNWWVDKGNKSWAGWNFSLQDKNHSHFPWGQELAIFPLQFWLLFSIGRKSHSVFYCCFRHQRLIAGFAFYSNHLYGCFPLWRWKAHKKLTWFRACRVLLPFIPGVTYCFFKQSKQRGFSKIQFLLFYCSINFIYVQICCFYQFGMSKRDASGGRNMTVLQNEALGRTGAGTTLDDQSY